MNLWPLMVFRMKGGKKFHINYAVVVALLLEYCLSIQWGVFLVLFLAIKKLWLWKFNYQKKNPNNVVCYFTWFCDLLWNEKRSEKTTKNLTSEFWGIFRKFFFLSSGWLSSWIVTDGNDGEKKWMNEWMQDQEKKITRKWIEG